VSAEHWPHRVGVLASLPRLLALRGMTPDRVLGAAGLAPDALSDPGKRIPFARGARAIGAAARMADCPHFGLIVGSQTRLADLGSVGAMMQRAPTVGAALRTLAAHQQLLSTGGAVFLQEHLRTVSIGYALFHPEMGRLRTTYDAAAAAAASLIRELCSDDWAPDEVSLPLRRSLDARPYEQFFHSAIRFDAEHLAISFPAALMDRPLQRRLDSPLPAPAGQDAARADVELLPQLYRSLRLLLLQGVAHGAQNARALAMSQRTLGRRLEALGVGFRQVLDDVRFGLARGLLGETDLPVVDIALSLGYAEASPFVRAFRRWSGMSPLQWRALHRSADADDGYGQAAEPGVRPADDQVVGEDDHRHRLDEVLERLGRARHQRPALGRPEGLGEQHSAVEQDARRAMVADGLAHARDALGGAAVQHVGTV
jgi:AraC-like DNA-binding protein